MDIGENLWLALKWGILPQFGDKKLVCLLKSFLSFNFLETSAFWFKSAIGTSEIYYYYRTKCMCSACSKLYLVCSKAVRLSKFSITWIHCTCMIIAL